MEAVEVSIRNFKSVREAKMRLGRVTVLLGPAASGKSNILEALALATYFDRYVLYDDVEPLYQLLRTEEAPDLFTFYDLTKVVEISLATSEWNKHLRLYFQKGLSIEVNDIILPIVSENYTPVYNFLRLFKHSGGFYSIHVEDIKRLGAMKDKVLGRFYGFDRFRGGVVNSISGSAEVGTPRDLLREDGKNIRVVAGKQLEVIRDINAELQEFGRIEVKLLRDRIVLFDNDVEMKPSAASDSIYRVLYNLIGLASTVYFVKTNGLEGRALALLEEPEAQIFPQFFNLLVKYVAKLSEVGYVVISTHNPILVSLLRDKVDVTLYYIYRGERGLTEVAELDKDKLAQELVTSLDLLFMKPREVLRLCRSVS